LHLGPPAFGGRYVSGLAARSALRGLRPLGLAFGHPCTSLGRSAVFFLLAFFFGGWAVLGPWAEAHGCGTMQTGGLKPLFAINDMGRWFQPSAHFIVFGMVAFVAVGFNPLGYTSILQAAKPPQA